MSLKHKIIRSFSLLQKYFQLYLFLTLIMISVLLTNCSILLIVPCQNQKSILAFNNHLYIYCNVKICRISNVVINLKLTWNKSICSTHGKQNLDMNHVSY